MKLSRSQAAVTSSRDFPVLAREDLVHPLLDDLQTLEMDGHIGDLALGAGGGLMDHDLRVGQRQTLALGARGTAGKQPMDAAMPMQMVDTSHLIYCMVS